MKIEIEIKSSYESTLKIDGREMIIKSEPGSTRLEGIKGPETENTKGGIVASLLFGRIGDIQQASGDLMDRETWEMLDDEEAEEFAESADGW